MQNGHLVQVGTLKNNALLTDVICGRGFGSVFRHHYNVQGRSLKSSERPFSMENQ